MKDLFLLLQDEILSGRDAMLLTVLRSRGSVPRGAGAMLLLGAAGPLSGTIGGGAAEHGAVNLARQLLAQRRSLSHTFSMGAGGGEETGMICGGTVTVWFAYIAPDDPGWRAVLAGIIPLLESGRGGRLVQRTAPGAPALLDGGGRLLAGAPVPEAIAEGKAGFLYQDGLISLPLSAGERAVIFGGGHCAHALVPVLDSVGFRVTVFEEREEFARPERFPRAERVLRGDYGRIGDTIALAPEDYVVVMTNNHSHDFTVLEQALRFPLAYAGCIGSRRKTALVNARLREAGVPEEAVARLHAPIGTPIRAETPEEIAVSIAGEMISLRAARREARGGEKGGCPMDES